jgi:Ulp1 family protease
MKAKKIQYFDSCGRTNWKKMKGLLQYLKDEYRAKHDGEEMDATEWELVPCKSDTPRQKNGEFHLKNSACQETQYSHSCHPFDLSSLVVGFDCGVFVCMFSYFISMDCSLVFDQDHIDHCRKIIALSIMNNCART